MASTRTVLALLDDQVLEYDSVEAAVYDRRLDHSCRIYDGYEAFERHVNDVLFERFRETFGLPRSLRSKRDLWNELYQRRQGPSSLADNRRRRVVHST